MDRFSVELLLLIFRSLNSVSKRRMRRCSRQLFFYLQPDDCRNPHIDFQKMQQVITFTHDVLEFWLLFANTPLLPGYAQIQTIQISFDYMEMTDSDWHILCLAMSKARPKNVNINPFQFAVSRSFIRIARLVSAIPGCTVMHLKNGVSQPTTFFQTNVLSTRIRSYLHRRTHPRISIYRTAFCPNGLLESRCAPISPTST
jgi:hypothetical protein